MSMMLIVDDGIEVREIGNKNFYLGIRISDLLPRKRLKAKEKLVENRHQPELPVKDSLGDDSGDACVDDNSNEDAKEKPFG